MEKMSGLKLGLKVLKNDHWQESRQHQSETTSNQTRVTTLRLIPWLTKKTSSWSATSGSANAHAHQQINHRQDTETKTDLCQQPCDQPRSTATGRMNFLKAPQKLLWAKLPLARRIRRKPTRK